MSRFAKSNRPCFHPTVYKTELEKCTNTPTDASYLFLALPGLLVLNPVGIGNLTLQALYSAEPERFWVPRPRSSFPLPYRLLRSHPKQELPRPPSSAMDSPRQALSWVRLQVDLELPPIDFLLHRDRLLLEHSEGSR